MAPPDDFDSTGKGIAGATVLLNGTEIAKEAVASIVVEQDVDEPDMAVVTVMNTSVERYTETAKLGDKLVVKISESSKAEPTTIFEGDVAGLEPHYESGGETQVYIRGFNKLHLLTRGKQYKTYENQTDVDIAKKIAGDVGLGFKSQNVPNITHKHVYLHGQTYLEFLLERARRINCEILLEGEKTMVFRKRDLSPAETLTLVLGAKDDSSGAPLRKLHVRLSTANQLSEVKVRGWDPGTAKEFIGKASSIAVTLGGTSGSAAAKKAFPGEQKGSFDVPVSSLEEANAVASAMLEDMALSYITGEGVAKGNPKLKAGIMVKITQTDKRTDGKYFVQGCTHRYAHKSSGSGGYTTILRLRRNAEG